MCTYLELRLHFIQIHRSIIVSHNMYVYSSHHNLVYLSVYIVLYHTYKTQYLHIRKGHVC